MERTTTDNASLENTKTSGAKFNDTDTEKRCPVCFFKPCLCAEIAKEKAQRDRAYANDEARLAKAKQEQEREIIRLGGFRAWQDFTAEKYTNKNLLTALSGYPNENFYIWGDVGVGKTHGATAIIRVFPDARVVTLGSVLREIAACDKSYQKEAAINKYSSGKYLFDDILTEKITPFLREIFFEIVNRRWLGKEGGAIFTSNKDIDAMEKAVGNKIASRLVDLIGERNILQLEGYDHRRYKSGELFDLNGV